MTEFEFVQVAVAIVMGLGLTDILRNIGEQFRRKNEVEIYHLQVIASCLLLLVILAYLWFFWRSSEVNWTLPLYALQMASAIALAFSAQMIKVDCTSARTPKEQYFASCTGIYVSWALAPAMTLIFLISSNDVDADDFGRIGIILLLLSMALIKKAIFHKVVLSILTLTVLTAPLLFQFEL